MSISCTGKLANEGDKIALDAVMKITNVYMGFTTAVITEGMTLSTITEASAFTRVDIASTLGTTTVGSGKASLANTSDTTSSNAGSAGQEIKGVFFTDASTGTAGKLLAYANLASSVFTNTGVPITIATGDLVIEID